MKNGMFTFVGSNDLCAIDRRQVVIVLFREAELTIREIGAFYNHHRKMEAWAFAYEEDQKIHRFMECVQELNLASQTFLDVQLDREMKYPE